VLERQERQQCEIFPIGVGRKECFPRKGWHAPEPIMRAC
jgi:hypothetical protein